uniref:Protein kinase domain-containing protein n=1 Tax=viral metagenome TaxID=1070528 RepID=A0A6C0KN82_9ZZZZ
MVKTKKNNSPKNNTKKKKVKVRSYSSWVKTHSSLFSHFSLFQTNRYLKQIIKALDQESNEQFDALSTEVKKIINSKALDENIKNSIEMLYKLSKTKTIQQYKSLFQKCTKGLKFKIGNVETNHCFEIEDNINGGAFGEIYNLKNDPNKVVKIQEIQYTDYDGRPTEFKEICRTIKQLQLEVKHMKIGAKLGISPVVYDHIICIDVQNSKFNSCIVMQKIDGVPLNLWLNEKGNELKPKDKQNIQNMVKKIHGKNIIHKDIHSGNIMVDKKRRFYLIDYGLSVNVKDVIQEEMEHFNKLLKSKYFQFEWRNKESTMTPKEELALSLLVLHEFCK